MYTRRRVESLVRFFQVWTTAIVLVIFSMSSGEAQTGSISGTIKDSDGNGIAGVYAQAFLATTGSWVNNSYRTDATGAYVIQGLEDESYKVFFRAYETNFESRWYSSSNPNGVGFDEASSVLVSGGGETKNINITLLAGSSISGQVVNDTGCDSGTVEGLYVMAYDSSEDLRDYATTSETGAFTIDGLPSGGSIKLKIWDFDGLGVEEWYQDAANFDGATFVSVPSSGITVNFCSLTPAGDFNWLLFIPAITHRPAAL